MKRTTVRSVRIRLLPLLAAWAMLVLFAACSKPEATSPGDPGIFVRLAFSRNHVIVDNGNDFVWKQVTVEMNGKYRYETALLPRGASSIPMNEFRDEAGNVFNPQQVKPHRLTVRVKEGLDGKPGSWEW